MDNKKEVLQEDELENVVGGVTLAAEEVARISLKEDFDIKIKPIKNIRLPVSRY